MRPSRHESQADSEVALEPSPCLRVRVRSKAEVKAKPSGSACVEDPFVSPLSAASASDLASGHGDPYPSGSFGGNAVLVNDQARGRVWSGNSHNGSPGLRPSLALDSPGLVSGLEVQLNALKAQKTTREQCERWRRSTVQRQLGGRMGLNGAAAAIAKRNTAAVVDDPFLD